MKHFRIALAALAVLLLCQAAAAQNMMMQKTTTRQTPVADGSDDVFIPISKYMAAGNSEALSAWFADNLEIAVLSRESDASRAQARQIVKTFFDNHTPRSFNITHIAGRAGMKYALGTLNAGGENFNVTIFLSCKNSTYRIQQLRIDRM